VLTIWRRAAIATAALAVASGVLAGPAQAARDRFAYGDSVMLGAKSQLQADGFRVDAHESRQAYSAPATMRKRAGSLPRNVVVHMGTNGTFPRSTCDALVKALAPDHRLFLVTVHVRRSWAASNNRMIRACVKAHADQGVRLVDWDAAASKNPGWLYSDGIHLRSSGARGYARLLDSAVDAAVRDERLAALASVSGNGRATVDH
jgi:hypothetical protein